MAKYGISVYGSATGLDADDIITLALYELGFPEAIDLSIHPKGTVIQAVYQTTLSQALSNYVWRFTMKRTQLLTRSDATDAEKYKYNFLFPANLLTLRTPYYDNSYSNPVREFESYPTYINTDATTCYIWYIGIIDESSFPQYFIDYFKYRLALDLCFNLTGDSELEKKLAMREQASLIAAKNIDAKQSPTRTIKASPFTSIRR